MQKYASVATDTAGNALAGATVTVKNGGSVTNATIYASNVGAALVNPFTTEVDGTYEFYAPNGRYDVTVAKPGYGFDATDTADVLLEDPLSAGSPAALAVSQNNWAPVDATTGLPMLAFRNWRISASAPVTITGIVAPLAHAAGLPIVLTNVGANAITLAHQDAASTAQYRLICPASASLVLTGTNLDSATLYYDVTTARWRVTTTTVTPTVSVAAGAIGGELTGLALTNNAGDATNDLDIAVGAAASDDGALVDRVILSLTAGITKRLDAAWAVGTNQGGLFSGAIANTTYHVFVIQRTDTGVVDAGFSTDPAAGDIPASYTKKRRVGSILREAGAIVAFTQDADYFERNVTVRDVASNNPGTGAVLNTLSIPTGLKLRAIFTVFFSDNSAANNALLVTNPNVSDQAPTTVGNGVAAPAAPGNTTGNLLNTASEKPSSLSQRIVEGTNTSAQVRTRVVASGATTFYGLYTHGWIDRRGRG